MAHGRTTGVSLLPISHRAAARSKTPTLRQVARIAPYMHDGSIATLEDVIDFYDRGGNADPNIDSELQPLRLSVEEKAPLLAFLRSLSSVIRDDPPTAR